MGRKKASRATSIRAMERELGPIPPERLADPLGSRSFPREYYDDGFGLASTRFSRDRYDHYGHTRQEYAPTLGSQSESLSFRQRSEPRPKSRFERKQRKQAENKVGKKNGKTKTRR